MPNFLIAVIQYGNFGTG